MELNNFLTVFMSMLKVLPVTLELSLLVLIFSLMIAIVMALCEYLNLKKAIWFINIYTSFFRGTPLVAQLFFFYYGLPSLIPSFTAISGFTAAVITLSLNTSAYMKESIRGALMSVEKGQIEAGLSIGYTELQTIRRIVFPQAARIALPSLANSFVDIIKGSSMAFTVGVFEMTAAAQLYSASTFRFFEGYASLIVMYWILIAVMEKLLAFLEKKLNEKVVL